MENKSQVAGILSIISGAFGILGMAWMLIVIRVVKAVVELDPTVPYGFFRIMTLFYLGIGVVLTIIGILGIVGGVVALKRKCWGLALAGAIASIFTFFPCGVAAVVIISMAKPEFNASTSIPPVT
jgi:hypothetical protein